MTSEESTQISFEDLDLIKPVLKGLNDVGYETPSPIQAQIIPYVMDGRDVLGQAQTGTGKTAAFALPILSRINIKKMHTQALVLAPTRELAIQVAEAFHRYAAHLKGFHVLPIYGGQSYTGQLRHLKRGVHVVVGTPGRVMDHMRRGSLNLENLTCLVLDEADEMLRMGFIDDVEWIMEQTPSERQVALFSATMPNVIRRIAQQHLKDPAEITIKVATTTADTIRQRYWIVSGYRKLDALTRILEAEEFDGMICFVRTKTATVELAEKLEARGFSASPLNGDISQNQRERTVERLKNGKIDILVATDVAARGLDVDRISHVINYDIPYDTEAYVHRIGRTGRAGRTGDAILFVAPRERRMLRAIERATKQKVELMKLPSTELINDQRIARFKDRITDSLGADNLDFYQKLMEQFQEEHQIPFLDIAAALAHMIHEDKPLLLEDLPKVQMKEWNDRPPRKGDRVKRDGPPRRPRTVTDPEEGMERFRMEVGHVHGVKPGNIVGAIANEADIKSENIGRIYIYDDYSTVDLPKGLPTPIFKALKKIWVSGQRLQISRFSGGSKGQFEFKKKGGAARRPKIQSGFTKKKSKQD